MGIPLSDYDEILNRPSRKAGGDDGPVLMRSDEAALDKAWSVVAEEDGVDQLPDQPSREEIRNS